MISLTSDQALIDSLTTASAGLKDAVDGLANISTALGADAVATPQAVFDAITTALDNANTALTGAQA